MSSPLLMTAEGENRFIAAISLAPAILILSAVVVVPILTVISFSLHDVSFAGEAGAFVGLENYVWVLTSAEFWTSLKNTLVWVFGSVALEMVLGLGLALMLNVTFVGRGVARTLVFAPYLIPTVVAVLVWRYMFHDIVGILNVLLMKVGLIGAPLNWLQSTSMAMVSVIIVGVWKFTPFVVLALLGVLQAIPQDQYEAAEIDGASPWQQFWRLTLPHLMPIFLLTALLRTIWTFHQFDIIYLLTGGGPINATQTLPLFVYQKAFVDFEMSRAAALAVVTAVILAIGCVVYFFLNKKAESWQ